MSPGCARTPSLNPTLRLWTTFAEGSEKERIDKLYGASTLVGATHPEHASGSRAHRRRSGAAPAESFGLGHHNACVSHSSGWFARWRLHALCPLSVAAGNS